MNKNVKLKTLCTATILTFMLGGCVAGKYKPVTDMTDLRISFADSKWDGKEIPKGQQCNKFGGSATTPSLMVNNIPDGTNALIMEYSDKSNARMNYGGHGKIGYNIMTGVQEVTVPSVPGHTYDLPKDFFLVQAHQNPGWDKAGAYMPPCSGGKGNFYSVEVKAVYEAPEGKESQLLGAGKLPLGTY